MSKRNYVVHPRHHVVNSESHHFARLAWLVAHLRNEGAAD